jgi:hypothetical protein
MWNWAAESVAAFSIPTRFSSTAEGMNPRGLWTLAIFSQVFC